MNNFGLPFYIKYDTYSGCCVLQADDKNGWKFSQAIPAPGGTNNTDFGRKVISRNPVILWSLTLTLERHPECPLESRSRAYALLAREVH